MNLEQRVTELERLVDAILRTPAMRLVAMKSGMSEARVTVTHEEQSEPVNKVHAYTAELQAGDKLANLAKRDLS